MLRSLAGTRHLAVMRGERERGTGVQASASGFGSAMVHPTNVDKTLRLLSYLSEVQRGRHKTVRDVGGYRGAGGQVIELDAVPAHPAVHVGPPSDDDPEAPVLVVDRLAPAVAPQPPAILAGWLDAPGPAGEPRLRASITKRRDGRNVVVALRERPEVHRAFHENLAAHAAWRAAGGANAPVRDLYAQLFQTFQAWESRSDTFELVVGIGLLSWAPPGSEPIRRHLVTFPASITLDDVSGALSVMPAGPASVEFDMLPPSLAPTGPQVDAAVGRLTDADAHPLALDAYADPLTSVANLLTDAAHFTAGSAPTRPGEQPVIAFAPAIVFRPRSQSGLLATFTAIHDQIASTRQVPAGLLPLIDPNVTPVIQPDDAPGALVGVDGDVFSPLPLNEAQLDIIQRVDRQGQTLVQGPPGTGKTHLAAALITHLLAQGKRVLVTAETDRALKEVRGKLPAGIQELAVAVLGTSRDDLAQLRTSVETISARANEGDAHDLARRMLMDEDGVLDRIDHLRRLRSQLHRTLAEAEADAATPVSFLGREGTLAALARELDATRASDAWLADYPLVRPGGSPLSDDEAVRLLALLRTEADAADVAEIDGGLVPQACLPTPDAFAALVAAEDAAQARAASSGPVPTAWEAIGAEGLAAVHEPALTARQRLAWLATQPQPWTRLAVAEVAGGGVHLWQTRLTTLAGLAEQARAHVARVAPGTRIDIAAGADRHALYALALTLSQALAGGQRINLKPNGQVAVGLFASRELRAAQPLFEAVRVNGLPPATLEAVVAVLSSMDAARVLDAMDAAWPSSVVVPAEDTSAERLAWHEQQIAVLEAVVAYGVQIEGLAGALSRRALPQPDWSDPAALDGLLRTREALVDRDALRAAQAPLGELEDALGRVGVHRDAPAAASVLAAVRARDVRAYGDARARYAEVLALADDLADREELLERLASWSPTLAHVLAAHPHDDAWDARLAHLCDAASWVALRDWIAGRIPDDRNAVAAQLDATEAHLRAEIERLATLRAWRHAVASDRITGQARADLAQYVQLVRRLGKGTGKYAGQRRAEIRRALDRCRASVPVWIMPIYRLASELAPSENMFDVVIVDEASQAGMEATFLQYLAPRIVVIGDDKQVSPAAVGVDQQELHDLGQRYLYDHRYRETWEDPKRSLFDAAALWFGSKRTLVEHRRCVPEIIGFSSRVAYEPDNIKLVPVRQFGADRLKPVETVFVPDGYESGAGANATNPPEARAVVERVLACLDDPAYADKTMGVISLSGQQQAKLIERLLLERVAPDAWAAHDLRCGDATDFQGSERDVMFLSMRTVVDPGKRANDVFGEAAVQRFNVAASRAKDQMWLFHSVTLDQLVNPEGLRHQLLNYCLNVVPALRYDESGVALGTVPDDERVEPFDSLFEQRVYNELVARGYSVLPQYASMGYRIDLVVQGAERRLAVECDGDAWHGEDQYFRDLARERDLRRNGWTFFRVRESTYYLDRAAALAPLWQLLDAEGIRPAGWADALPAAGDARSGQPAGEAAVDDPPAVSADVSDG